MPLEHVGRYKIDAELGKGAMGVVYRATDPNIGRTVALKTLRVDVHGMESDEMLKRFQAEARNAGILSHPNIVTVYDAQEIEGLFYIAMEFIQGQTLQELLKIGGMTVERMIEVTKQVCAGLDYAHARGIVHRDIKPANIMIQPDSTVKIMDFGIAKGAGTGMTSTGQVLGTPNYMSPEQVKGKTLDGRSDLFSLGVVLYEMLTGVRPFTGDNVTTIIYKIVNENPPAPTEVNTNVHPGLSAVVMKALEKNREQRYQKCGELARELENYRGFGNATGQASGVPTESQSTTPVRPVVLPATVSAGGGAAAATKRALKHDTTVVAKPAAVKVAPQKAAPAKKPPIAIIVGALAVVIAIAGYVGLKLKKAPEPDNSAPVAQADTPSETTAVETPAHEPKAPRPKSGPKTAAKPKTEAAVPTGDLHVTSSPPGASINLDGNDIPQVTPAVLKLPSGQHAVVVSMDGFRPETRHPDITVGQRTNITAILAPIAGFMMVNSTPSGADILVDGKSTGSVTPSRIKVTQGQHTFTVHKQGAKDQSTSLFVLAGQTLPLEFTFPGASGAQPKKGAESVNVPPSNEAADEKNAKEDQPDSGGTPFRKLRRLFGGREDKGTIIIRTQPDGAEVWVDGKRTDYTTPAKFNAPLGKYKVSVRLAGYKSLNREIEIEKGKTITIDEDLHKK